MQSSSRSQRGFTLAGLLATLTIVGMLTLIALPSFQQVRLGRALMSAQNAVTAAVQKARWMAINGGAPRTINLANSGQVQIQNSGGTVLQSVALGGFSVTQSVTAPNGTTSIVFDRRGVITSPGTTPVTITLTNPRGVTKTISVDVMGRVQNS